MEVIILAGGLGTRLRSVVSQVPKCMAPVAGKPFLWYLLENLRRFDVSKLILSVGYLREVVQTWVSEHASDYPFEICFAVEDQPLGTGGAIKLASSFADGPEVVVINGDTFFDADLQELVDERRNSGAPVAIALKPMLHFDRYGTVELGADGMIKAFREKTYCDAGLINGGIYAIDLGSGLFDGLADKFSFEKDILEAESLRGRLCGAVQEGFFIDIGIPDDYSRADTFPELLAHKDSLLDVVRRLEGFDTLLLDRDGVINRLRPGDYVKSIDEFEWLPSVRKALCEAASKFSGIFVVTNQRGVGKGVMSRGELDKIHSWMCSSISEAGGRIDDIYVCTAVADDDPFRKPNTGMFDELLRNHPDVDPARTVMIGDSASDAEFARRCGVSFIKV